MKFEVERDNPLAYLQLFLTKEVIEKIVRDKSLPTAAIRYAACQVFPKQKVGTGD